MKKQKITKPLRCACCGGEELDICLVDDGYGYTRKELLCRTCDYITVLNKNGDILSHPHGVTIEEDTVKVVTKKDHAITHGFKDGKLPASAIIDDDFEKAFSECINSLHRLAAAYEKALNNKQK